MAQTQYTINAPPERVFAVLSDGWTYSDWVVGTAHIREVDPTWPAPGSRLHITAGVWPLTLRGQTRALASEAPSRLVLRPKLWPLGELTATFTLAPTGNGSTRVTLAEDFDAGPMRWIRTKINDLLLHTRNREALRRLADIIERRGPRN